MSCCCCTACTSGHRELILTLWQASSSVSESVSQASKGVRETLSGFAGQAGPQQGSAAEGPAATGRAASQQVRLTGRPFGAVQDPCCSQAYHQHCLCRRPAVPSSQDSRLLKLARHLARRLGQARARAAASKQVRLLSDVRC